MQDHTNSRVDKCLELIIIGDYLFHTLQTAMIDYYTLHRITFITLHQPSAQVSPTNDVISQLQVNEFHSWMQSPPLAQDVTVHSGPTQQIS